MVGSHELNKSEMDGMIPDSGNGINHSVFNFDNNLDSSIHGADHISTANLSAESSSISHSQIIAKAKPQKVPGKRQKHVRKACIHCKKAHLACDEARPCKRCLHLGKPDCIDVEHKRRGRPRSSPEKKRATPISVPVDYMLGCTNDYSEGEVYSIEPQEPITLPGLKLENTK